MIDSLDPAYTTDFTYDDYGRLKGAQAGAWRRNYSYDAWGNLRSVWGGSGGEAPNYTLNYALNGGGAPATNRVLNINGVTAVSYDAADPIDLTAHAAADWLWKRNPE